MLVLPWFWGQTALNLTLDLSEDPRFIEKEIPLGSNIGAVKQAEDREKFKELVQSLWDMMCRFHGFKKAILYLLI